MSKAFFLRSLCKSLVIQWRVIHAVLMREIITRYGRHNIGFAWMFAEPMIFTLGVVIIWGYSHELGSDHHINATAFTITGYTTILTWRNTIGRCVDSVEPNRSLLFYNNVRIIDVFIARIILELGGITLSTSMIFTWFIFMGWIPMPADMLTMFIAWGLLCWYAAAMSLLVGALSEYSELVDKIWHPLSYFQLPLSGAFAMAAWLPVPLRKILLIFPVPNAVEMFREGYYGGAIKATYSLSYVITICLFITWFGLYAVRFVSNGAGK